MVRKLLDLLRNIWRFYWSQVTYTLTEEERDNSQW